MPKNPELDFLREFIFHGSSRIAASYMVVSIGILSGQARDASADVKFLLDNSYREYGALTNALDLYERTMSITGETREMREQLEFLKVSLDSLLN